MKCFDCPHLVYTIENNATKCTARCNLCGVRKGKRITWAMTTVSAYDLSHRIFCTENVVNAMKAKKSAPRWCPIKTEKETKQ